MLTSFFPRLLWIPAVKRTKLKKLSISTTKSGGAQHHKQTNKQTNKETNKLNLIIDEQL